MSLPAPLPLPDQIHGLSAGSWFKLAKTSAFTWDCAAGQVRLQPQEGQLSVEVEWPGSPLSAVVLRWNMPPAPGLRLLGDAWERSYGELEWRGLVADRPMPWYFFTWDGSQAAGYGVRTAPGALCCWQVDAAGLSLWLDTRSGGQGVQLGQRALPAAVLVAAHSRASETPFAFACRFTRLLCPRPAPVAAPVYGANNWYYAYGLSSEADILRDSHTVSDLSPDPHNRPFSVIDAGWQYTGGCNGSPWQLGNRAFPDLPGLAAKIGQTGCKPGIWYRPLLNTQFLPAGWQLSPQRFTTPNQPGTILDPSVPEVLDLLRQDITHLADWGFALIKHDFSTFDLFGKWGFQMSGLMTDDGWSFHDTGRTSAEILRAFYETLYTTIGQRAVLIGCNTIGHLAAGVVHLQRIGDDTSGKDWSRTRKMGVNTLAFRAAQHQAFFENDADCVGLTQQIPWELNQQWLDLLSRSGTPLFVSPDPAALGPAQRSALRQAFARAARPQPLAEPLDWLDTPTPTHWKFGNETSRYRWATGEPG